MELETHPFTVYNISNVVKHDKWLNCIQRQLETHEWNNQLLHKPIRSIFTSNSSSCSLEPLLIRFKVLYWKLFSLVNSAPSYSESVSMSFISFFWIVLHASIRQGCVPPLFFSFLLLVFWAFIVFCNFVIGHQKIHCIFLGHFEGVCVYQ